MSDILQSVNDHLVALQASTKPILDEDKVYNATRVLKNTSSITELTTEDGLRQLLTVTNSILVEFPQIDTNLVLVEFLTSLLKFFTFKDIETYYTKAFIVEAPLSSAPASITLIYKVIQEKFQDPDTLVFLQSTQFLFNATSGYFSEKTDLSVASAYENLVTIFAEHPAVTTKLQADEFIEIYAEVKRNQDSTLLTRLVDFLAILAPYVLIENSPAQLSLPYDLFKYTRTDFLKDDPLLVILLISFYKKLIALELEQNFFDEIKPSLYDLFYLFSVRTSDVNVQSFYAAEIVELINKWSYSSQPFAIAYLNELLNTFEIFKSYNLYLDSSEADIALLSGFNPILTHEDLIDDIAGSFSLFSKRYFTILLNVIASSNYFLRLVETEQISVARISKLSSDMLYRLLYEITKFKHSTLWLLDQAQLISDSILGTTITENEIWSLKKKTLENLIWRNTEEELGVWCESVKKAYSVMSNGRNVKDIVPKVEIADETA